MHGSRPWFKKKDYRILIIFTCVIIATIIALYLSTNRNIGYNTDSYDTEKIIDEPLELEKIKPDKLNPA